MKLPTIADALETYRKAHSLTGYQMADKIGIARGHYSEVVNHLRILPLNQRCKAFELGISPEVLLQTPNTKQRFENGGGK